MCEHCSLFTSPSPTVWWSFTIRYLFSFDRISFWQGYDNFDFASVPFVLISLVMLAFLSSLSSLHFICFISVAVSFVVLFLLGKSILIQQRKVMLSFTSLRIKCIYILLQKKKIFALWRNSIRGGVGWDFRLSLYYIALLWFVITS